MELRRSDDSLTARRTGRFPSTAAVGLVLLVLLGAPSAGASSAASTKCMGLSATISGTDGQDLLFGTGGDDVIVGNGGDDTIDGFGGNDTICGGPGVDIINAGPANDRIDGGPGQDGLEGGPGDDVLDGGKQARAQSADFVWYKQASGSVEVNLTAGRATGGDGSDTIKRAESVYGSRFPDTLIGDSHVNILGGEGGNDRLEGKAGADMASFDAPVQASLETDTATGEGSDHLTEMEGLIGSDGKDVLVGDASDNYLKGGGGNDELSGGGGDDRLYGEGGGDTIKGDAGDDTVDGGTGDDALDGGGQSQDTVSYSSAAFSGVVVDLASHRARGEGRDTITGFRNVSGSAFRDRLFGDAAANALFGNDGNDVIRGRAGADFLGGGFGKNVLADGAGTDYCLRGLGERRCEISGVPALPATSEQPPLGRAALFPVFPLVAKAARSGFEYVGAPTCRTVKRAHETTIAPPRRVDPVGDDGVPEEALWRGTLYRRRGRGWRVFRQTPWARGAIAGTRGGIAGVPVWQDESLEKVVGRFKVTVPAGMYVWRGYIYWRRNRAHVFRPVEPHIVYGATVRHDRECRFG